MTSMPTRLLVLEDDDGLRASLRLLPESDGYEVVEAAEAEGALETVQAAPVDLMLVDLLLGGMDGFTFIRRARPTTEAPIVVISARDGVEDIVQRSRPAPTTTSPNALLAAVEAAPAEESIGLPDGRTNPWSM